jgi:hypothetical protein
MPPSVAKVLAQAGRFVNFVHVTKGLSQAIDGQVILTGGQQKK